MPVRERIWAALLISATAVPATGSAQATKDQSRLIFTVSAGAVAGGDLWTVGAQSVQFTDPIDTLALDRDIRSSLNIGFAGTYFPGDNLGFSFEAFLVGLGFEDACRVTFSSGSVDVINACQSIQGATKSATAVTLTVGPVLRFNSRKLLSPYARGNLGVVISNQSSIRTVGQFPAPEGPVDLIIYDDDKESRIEPSFTLGAGITAAIAPGYQLQFEARDNIVGIQTVTAAAPQARTIPPHELTFKHLFSVTIGFNVVLERRRGKRY
jgi:opacity protein-like surface antigen